MPHVCHYSAGELVRKVDHIKDPLLRQIKLGEVLAQLGENERAVAIDGHLVLPADTGFFEVPFEALAALNPSALIVITDDCQLIAERRAKDLTRLRGQLSTDLLGDWQRRECFQALSYAARLGVPYREVSGSDTPRFLETLALLIASA